MKDKSNWYWFNLKLTYWSLIILALGAFTSITLLALSHILIFFPAIYFTNLFFKGSNKKKIPLSLLALLALFVVIVLSLIFNFNILVNPFSGFKFKYFLLSALGIFAYKEAFENYIDLKKRRILLSLFLLSTTIATISGLIAIPTGFNYLTRSPIHYIGRASGLNGMIMTYGYGISLFMVLLTGLVINREKMKQYIISSKLLIIYWIINFLGLYFSYARGAWLGFFLSIPFLFWRTNKKYFLYLSTFSILIIGLSITYNKIASNRFKNSTGSDKKRIAFFQTAIHAFLERPVLGWGYNNLEPNMKSLKIKYNLEYPELEGKAHNNFLEFLATTGIIGFSFLVLFHIFWAIEGLKFGPFGDINLAFVISLTISGMFQHTLSDGSNLFFIMGYYSIFAAISLNMKKPERDPYFTTKEITSPI